MFSITAPICALLKKEVAFQWKIEQEKAFKKITNVLTTTLGLQLYDPFCSRGGREVKIRSEHKLLEMITQKSIHQASPRTQAMLLKHMKCNFYVKYQPGPTMSIVDALSRTYVDGATEFDVQLEVDTSLRLHAHQHAHL